MADIEIGDVISTKLVDKIPNVMGEAIYQAVSSDEELENYIIAAHLTSARVEAEKYYAVAKKWSMEAAEGIPIKDRVGYPFGLPKADLRYDTIKVTEATQYLKSIFPSDIISRVQASLGLLSYINYIYQYFLDTYPEFNMRDKCIFADQAIQINCDAIHDISTQRDPLGNTIIEVTFKRKDPLSYSFGYTYHTSQFPMPTDWREDWLQFTFFKNGKEYYYNEKVDTTNVSLIDNISNAVDLEIYPIVALKLGTHFITDDEFISSEFLQGISKDQVVSSTDKLLRCFGLVTQELIDGLNGTSDIDNVPEDQTPDKTRPDVEPYKLQITKAYPEGRYTEADDDRKDFLAALEDAYFMLAVDIYTQLPASARYLFYFFDKVCGYVGKDTGSGSANKMGIYDGIDTAEDATARSAAGSTKNKARRFNCTISWNASSKRVVEGVVIPVDELDKKHDLKDEGGVQNVDSTGKPNEAMQIAFGEKIILPDMSMHIPPIPDIFNMGKYSNSKIILRRQLPKINPTDKDEFEEIVLIGLTHFTITSSRKYGHAVIAYLSNRNEPGEKKWENDRNGFYLPLARDILYEVDKIFAFNVIYDSYHIVCFMVHKIDLKWYQKGWFKIVMMIIAIVLIYLSWGTATAAVGSLFSVTPAIAAAIYVGVLILAPLLINLLITKVGGDLGTALAIIVAIAAAFITGGRSLTALLEMTLMQLTTLALNLASSIMQIYTQVGWHELEQKTEDWLDEREEMEQEKDELEDLLGDSQLAIVDTSPFIDYEYQENTYEPEGVDAMLNRNFAFLNANIMSDIVSDFADLALTLPVTLKT